MGAGFRSLLLAAMVTVPAARAGKFVEVGSFIRPTSTVTQPFGHQLGVTPKLLLLWTAGKTAEDRSADFQFSFGVMTGIGAVVIGPAEPAAGGEPVAIGGGAVAFGVGAHARTVDPLTFEVAQGRQDAALFQVDSDLQVVSQANFNSWDAESVTLNWVVNNGAAPALVHYAVFGGDALEVEVITSGTPESAPDTVSLPFAAPPEVVLLLGGAFGSLGVPQRNGQFSLGAWQRDGAQWCSSFGVQHGATVSAFSSVGNCQCAVNAETGTMENRGSCAALDGSAIGVTYAVAGPAPIVAIGLRGVPMRVGAFPRLTNPDATNATALQSVHDRVVPQFLLFASAGIEAENDSQYFSYLVGATDRVLEASSNVACDALLKTSAGSDRTSAPISLMFSDGTNVEAEGNATPLSDGFAVEWTFPATAPLADLIGYVSLGQPASNTGGGGSGSLAPLSFTTCGCDSSGAGSGLLAMLVVLSAAVRRKRAGNPAD